MPKKSIYTIVFEHGGKFFLYNSRSNFFSEITERLFYAIKSQSFESLTPEETEELKSRQLIVKDDEIHDYYYMRLMDFHARNNNRNTLHLTIAPTTACNFDCPYCFESKLNPKTMSDDVIEKIPDFIKGYKDAKKLVLNWYGGEPLIAFGIMGKIYESLSGKDMPTIESQSIITNGYCLTQEVIDFFRETGCHDIQITIDGIGEKHDLTRRLRNSSEPTFDRIISNVDLVLSQLKETTLNIRVNVNKKNYRDFVEVFNFLRQRHPDSKNLNIYPGIIRQETADHLSLCESSFRTSEMLELHRLLREEGIDTRQFPRKTFRGCMMHDNMSYIIGPEGELYKCCNDIADPAAVIGNIASPELVNTSRLIKYAVRSIPFNDECRDCHAFPICDGGCSYHRFRNKFEGCRFDVCSPYRDMENLKSALLTEVYK